MNKRTKWVIDYCARKHGVTPELIVGDLRLSHIVRARHEAMWIMRKALRRRAARRDAYSYPAIGRIFGGRDHSTVIHAVKKHRERMDAGIGV